MRNKKQARTRWSRIANEINGNKIESYIEALQAEPKNFIAMQRLGILLKNQGDEDFISDPLLAFQMFRCAALLMQKSVQLQGEDVCSSDEDFPWKELGEVQLRSWLLQGVKGDIEHLELSSKAWSYAAKQQVNLDAPRVLVQYALTLQFLGNQRASAHILGDIIGKFPSYKNLNSVCLQACVVLKSLRQFKQAAAYLENVMKYGPPAPYTVVDLMFIMGRIYEEWSQEADSGHEQTSHKAYMRIFTALKNDEIIPSMANFDDWIGDAVTWCSLAEKCCSAGHYVLAADFFTESINRYEDEEYHEPLAALYFELSKCWRRSGKIKLARQSLEKALQIDRKDAKMSAVWNEWEDPSHVFAAQLNLPPNKFAKKLKELIPA